MQFVPLTTPVDVYQLYVVSLCCSVEFSLHWAMAMVSTNYTLVFHPVSGMGTR